MRVYYLEEPLSDDDLAFIVEAMDCDSTPDQIRVPHVLPAVSPSLTETEYRKHEELLGKALKNCGIARDRGIQVLCVSPQQMYWHSVLVNAIYRQTGAYPWLVQTREHRIALGNPGETRILDTHGLMGLKS